MHGLVHGRAGDAHEPPAAERRASRDGERTERGAATDRASPADHPFPTDRATASGRATGTDRATAPVVGAALLVLCAAALSATVGAAALTASPPEPAPVASFSLAVEGDTVAVTHRGGAAVDVGALRVVVAVDGARLRRQPPVPFFAARGFASGPTGPFNVASDPVWTAGETASFAVAGTNGPQIAPGATVEVALYADGRRLATLSATAT